MTKGCTIVPLARLRRRCTPHDSTVGHAALKGCSDVLCGSHGTTAISRMPDHRPIAMKLLHRIETTPSLQD